MPTPPAPSWPSLASSSCTADVPAGVDQHRDLRALFCASWGCSPHLLQRVVLHTTRGVPASLPRTRGDSLRSPLGFWPIPMPFIHRTLGARPARRRVRGARDRLGRSDPMPRGTPIPSELSRLNLIRRRWPRWCAGLDSRWAGIQVRARTAPDTLHPCCGGILTTRVGDALETRTADVVPCGQARHDGKEGSATRRRYRPIGGPRP
jgi:hypothetical protein